MNAGPPIDVERVICRLDELASSGTHGFAIGGGDWPLRGFVVYVNNQVRGFVNRCPHVGHPLNLRPHRFLTADGTLILCSSHGALFEKATGLCVAGPCAGQYLEALPLKIESGFVMLADDAEPS